MSPPPPLRSSRHPRQVHHASVRTVSKRTELTTPGSDGLRDLIIHDIRTPLAAISGHAQLLRRRCSSAEPKAAELLQAMQVIERAATRIDQLLDELANITPPAHAGHEWLRREPVDLLALTRRAVAQSQAIQFGPPRITIFAEAPELVGWWDARCLERVIANLLGNALKYSPEAQGVVVTVRRMNNWAELKVADQGVGVPALELARVLEPGYRGSNVANQVPGTGLGLARASELVALHGGTMALESTLGVGTTLTVRLPLDD
jgi:signal transduction histidine kinase